MEQNTMNNGYFFDNNTIRSYIEENKNDILDDIAAFVSIPSVSERGSGNTPFGESCKEALDLALSRSRSMGLDAENIDNRVACISIPGNSSNKYIATVTHLDVVPAGDGWKESPFIMRTIGDYIIGRGVIDDKGPSVLCLYALKFFLKYNIKLNYSIKSIFGFSEETGMEDIVWYLTHRKAPDFAFSPDADFPVCNGEKGIYHAELISKYPLHDILELSGGDVINAVPGDAYAILRSDVSKRLATCKIPQYISVIKTGVGRVKIISKGISAHASTPEKGLNAVFLLIHFLLRNNIIDNEADRKILSCIEEITAATDGTAQNISCTDENFGSLTLLGSKIQLKDNSLRESIDCRYPTGITGDSITEALQNHYGHYFRLCNIENAAPFYISPDSPAIIACLSAYNDVQKKNSRPITISGGTYARNFPYAVAFGPMFPEENKPTYIGDMHGPEEGASISHLLKALEIYIKTLLNLQSLEKL